MPANHVLVEAVFESSYTVIVSSPSTGAEGNGSYYAGDTVRIYAGETPAGQGFKLWETTSPGVAFNDGDSMNTFFIMPGNPVAVRAVFDDLLPDGKAFVRFTWESTAEAPLGSFGISDIAADYYNVSELIAKIDLGNYADLTDIPLFDGNPTIWNWLYSGGSFELFGISWYNGIYFETGAGSYTAICAGWHYFGLFYIVANYHITLNHGTIFTKGTDRYFEVAFDVTAFIRYENESGWFFVEHDNSHTPPSFTKTKAVTQQIINADGVVDIEYYMIHKPER
jgi:hypothetical protein